MDVATNDKSANSTHVPGIADLDYSLSRATHYDPSGGVQVELSSAWSGDGKLIVRARFTPDDPAFHLYSKDLPRKGVNGIGRPTLIEVADRGRFTEIGELIADQKAIQQLDATSNTSHSIYPSGPVTLYLSLLRPESSHGQEQITIRLTYMSCSERVCNLPVERAAVSLTLPTPVAVHGND